MMMEVCPECGGSRFDKGTLFGGAGSTTLVKRCLGCDRCCDVKTGEVVN